MFPNLAQLLARKRVARRHLDYWKSKAKFPEDDASKRVRDIEDYIARLDREISRRGGSPFRLALPKKQQRALGLLPPVNPLTTDH